MVQPVDPKTVIDSIGDGVAEVISIYGRVIEGLGGSAAKYGRDVEQAFAKLKGDLPDRPEGLASFVVSIVGSTVKGVVGGVEGVVGAVDKTAKGLGREIGRVAR